MNEFKWSEDFLQEFSKLSKEERIKYMAWIWFRQDLTSNFNIDIETDILYQKNDIYSTKLFNDNYTKIQNLADKLYWHFYKLNKNLHVDKIYELQIEAHENGEEFEKDSFNYPNYFDNWKAIGGII